MVVENSCEMEIELEIEVEMWHVCPLCKVAYENESELLIHNESIHPQLSPNLFRSDYLKALLTSGSRVNISSQAEVKNNKKCRKKFEGSYNYNAFECDLCLSKFSRKSYLDRHIRFHNEGKILSCEFCGMKFRKNHRYEKHRKNCLCLSTNNS